MASIYPKYFQQKTIEEQAEYLKGYARFLWDWRITNKKWNCEDEEDEMEFCVKALIKSDLERISRIKHFKKLKRLHRKNKQHR